MPEPQKMYNKHQKYLMYLLSIFVLGWGFTSFKPVFAGLILGTTVSFFNYWLLARRTERFGEVVMEGKKPRFMGTLTRMASAVLATMVALKYSDNIHFPSVIIGLMISYIVIVIDVFIIGSIISRRDREER